MHAYSLHCHRSAQVFALAIGLLAATAASATPFSDFDDGTLQGWEPVIVPITGFGGVLEHVPTGGNPGGFMRASDTIEGTGTGFLGVKAPAEFNGDLSAFTHLQWDQYLYDYPNIVRNTFPVLDSPDGETSWRADLQPEGPAEQWDTRIVSLDEIDWRRTKGTLSLDEVLADARLVFAMDVVYGPVPSLESGLDNIRLIVPEPSALALLVIGGLAVTRRRRVA